MNPPKKILVPVDFSSCSETALDYAVQLARKIGATVDMVSAITIPALGVPDFGVGMDNAMFDKVVAETEASLEKLAATHNDGPSQLIDQRLIRSGDAREVILRTAEELEVDLIVMGTHGR